MKFVVDSSVAFKWVIAEVHQDRANQLRDDFRQGIHELIAPDIFPVEVAHALTRAERQGRITPGQAAALWADVMTTAPVLHASLPLTLRALAVSSQMRVGVYDCVYVALAEREGCAFVTADDRLVNALQQQFPFIVYLATLPGPPTPIVSIPPPTP